MVQEKKTWFVFFFGKYTTIFSSWIQQLHLLSLNISKRFQRHKPFSNHLHSQGAILQCLQSHSHQLGCLSVPWSKKGWWVILKGGGAQLKYLGKKTKIIPKVWGNLIQFDLNIFFSKGVGSTTNHDVMFSVAGRWINFCVEGTLPLGGVRKKMVVEAVEAVFRWFETLKNKNIQ